MILLLDAKLIAQCDDLSLDVMILLLGEITTCLPKKHHNSETSSTS